MGGQGRAVHARTNVRSHAGHRCWCQWVSTISLSDRRVEIENARTHTNRAPTYLRPLVLVGDATPELVANESKDEVLPDAICDALAETQYPLSTREVKWVLPHGATDALVEEEVICRGEESRGRMEVRRTIPLCADELRLVDDTSSVDTRRFHPPRTCMPFSCLSRHVLSASVQTGCRQRQGRISYGRGCTWEGVSLQRTQQINQTTYHTHCATAHLLHAREVHGPASHSQQGQVYHP
jgi:hypothetical protein